MTLNDRDMKLLIIAISIFLCMAFMHMLLKNSVAVRCIGCSDTCIEAHNNPVTLEDGTVVFVCPKCNAIIKNMEKKK